MTFQNKHDRSDGDYQCLDTLSKKLARFNNEKAIPNQGLRNLATKISSGLQFATARGIQSSHQILLSMNCLVYIRIATKLVDKTRLMTVIATRAGNRVGGS